MECNEHEYFTKQKNVVSVYINRLTISAVQYMKFYAQQHSLVVLMQFGTIFISMFRVVSDCN